jgi:hypothetical protein
MADLLYGFVSLADRAEEIVDNIDIETMNAAVDASLQQHTQTLSQLMSVWATPTTAYSERHKSIASEELQPLDEYGRALPTKGKIFQTVAYPLFRAGTALGMTYEARQKMTVQELNDLIAGKTTADARTMRKWLMQAIFDESGYTFTDEVRGDLSIKGFANGDTDTYISLDSAEDGATDDHYLATADAIADATNPFPTIHEELLEHPENGGEVIAFIPTNLVATTKALTDFVPVTDPRIRTGSTTDVLVGGPGIAHPGKLIGYTNEVWVVEWRGLPTSYIAATTTGGERALAFREDESANLRGFRRVAERNDHPYYESQYLRKGGFGGRNRVNGLVMRIGNGSWAVPAGMETLIV